MPPTHSAERARPSIDQIPQATLHEVPGDTAPGLSTPNAAPNHPKPPHQHHRPNHRGKCPRHAFLEHGLTIDHLSDRYLKPRWPTTSGLRRATRQAKRKSFCPVTRPPQPTNLPVSRGSVNLTTTSPPDPRPPLPPGPLRAGDSHQRYLSTRIRPTVGRPSALAPQNVYRVKGRHPTSPCKKSS